MIIKEYQSVDSMTTSAPMKCNDTDNLVEPKRLRKLTYLPRLFYPFHYEKNPVAF